jgi:hypothetical protein
VELGCDDARLDASFEWLARGVTGEGVAPNTERKAPLRYYAYHCGPNFACGANGGQPCAWGAVKVMLALSRWPAERRTPIMERAIKRGVDFLLSTDPALAEYPHPYAEAPSGNWWKLGFPVFYVTDLLQSLEALVGLDLGSDPRLSQSLQMVRDKQDVAGRWRQEYNYGSKTWGNFGRKGEASPWVTLRALRVLKALDKTPTI